MVEAAGGLRFAQGEHGIEVGANQLDRHLTTDGFVDGTEDAAHGSAAQRSGQAIATGDQRL